jgi:hypothetical protein
VRTLRSLGQALAERDEIQRTLDRFCVPSALRGASSVD